MEQNKDQNKQPKISPANSPNLTQRYNSTKSVDITPEASPPLSALPMSSPQLQRKLSGAQQVWQSVFLVGSPYSSLKNDVVLKPDELDLAKTNNYAPDFNRSNSYREDHTSEPGFFIMSLR